MADLFKNVYNPVFFKQFTDHLKMVQSDFDDEGFLKHLFNDDWETKELKERMRHTTIVLREYLPVDFSESAYVLLNTIDQLKSNDIQENSIEYMFIPDFVEQYGISDFETSVHALERITQFTSCEFGVRPFLIKYPDRMMDQMLQWSKHGHPKVRRLATEGCRPRLPWAMALPFLKKDPTPILPILENLKKDTSEFVRRSVANNLNDISKDHPALVLDLVGKWKDGSKEIDWLVKHACRTLLKQGHPAALALFGLGAVEGVTIRQFKVDTPKLTIGNYLKFTCQLVNQNDHPVKLRLEYAVYYMKANGTLSKKVYKISEKEYAANSSSAIERRQHFKPISTRKYHSGLHQVAMIVNGREFEKLDFILTI